MKDPQVRSALVLGAGGLVGAALMRVGAQKGPWAVRGPSGQCLVGVTGFSRQMLDITKQDQIDGVLDRVQPIVVINAAAQAKVDLAENEPENTWLVNADAPGWWAEACRSRGVRFLHLSTDYVLDEPGKIRLNETVPPNPRGAYARSKLEGEERVLGQGGTVVRLQWVYHPTHGGFFARAIESLRRGERLRLVADQIGVPTPVEWVAGALLECATQLVERPPVELLFHLACMGEASAYEWIEEAANVLELPFGADVVTRAQLGGAHRPERSCLDATRFSETFGVDVPDWRDAMRQVLVTEASS